MNNSDEQHVMNNCTKQLLELLLSATLKTNPMTLNVLNPVKGNKKRSF